MIDRKGRNGRPVKDDIVARLVFACIEYGQQPVFAAGKSCAECLVSGIAAIFLKAPIAMTEEIGELLQEFQSAGRQIDRHRLGAAFRQPFGHQRIAKRDEIKYMIWMQMADDHAIHAGRRIRADQRAGNTGTAV